MTHSAPQGRTVFTAVLWTVAGLELVAALSGRLWLATRFAIVSVVVLGAVVAFLRWAMHHDGAGWPRLGAFALMAVLVAWQGYDIQMIRPREVVPWAIPVFAFLAMVVIACRPPDGRPVWARLVVMAAVPSLPFTSAANAVFDTGVTAVHRTFVVGFAAAGIDRTVAPWPGLRAPIELELNREMARRLDGSPQVEVHVKPGWLGIEWIDDVRSAP